MVLILADFRQLYARTLKFKSSILVLRRFTIRCFSASTSSSSCVNGSSIFSVINFSICSLRILPEIVSASFAFSEPSVVTFMTSFRSEEHTSELQSRGHLVCRLLLDKKNLLHWQHIHHVGI